MEHRRGKKLYDKAQKDDKVERQMLSIGARIDTAHQFFRLLFALGFGGRLPLDLTRRGQSIGNVQPVAFEQKYYDHKRIPVMATGLT